MQKVVGSNPISRSSPDIRQIPTGVATSRQRLEAAGGQRSDTNQGIDRRLPLM
jgi:hypothetical protein